MVSTQWLRKCYNSGAREVVLHPASSSNINRRRISSSSRPSIRQRQTRFLTISSATQRLYTPDTILLIAKAVQASPKVQPRHTPSIRMSLQEVATRMPLTPWSSASVTSSLIRISTTQDTQVLRIKSSSSSLQLMISRLIPWDSKVLLQQKLMKQLLIL